MEELRKIYRKRKKQLLPLIFGLATFFILFRVILPSWTDIQDVQSLLTTKLATIKVKEANILLLNSLQDGVIDEKYALVSTALPVQKDIVLIFSQLSAVAQKSGVKLGAFSVKVGGIYSTTKNTKSTEAVIEGVPYLSTVISVSGENANLRQFAEDLYQSIPLVEITNVDITKNDARLAVNLFFKPIAPSDNKAEAELKGFTIQEDEEMEKLSSWSLDSVTPSEF